MRKLIPLMVYVVLLVSFVDAAIIHGEIYDFSLEKVVNVKVEIDTSPRQVLISKDGSYSFNAPVGEYSIKVDYLDSFAEESVIVKGDGDYVLDIILFPKVDEGLLDDVVDVNDEYFESKLGLYIVIGIIIVLGIGYFVFMRGKKEEVEVEERNDLNEIVDIVKEAGGRINQKEIRKKIRLSEAKISLMIAELEDKGVIKKIKKGRGNIIILK